MVAIYEAVPTKDRATVAQTFELSALHQLLGDSCPEEAYRDALKLGEELAAAQQRLSHHGNGTFGKWCEQRCGMTRRTATSLILIRERLPSKDWEIVFQTFDLTALYKLLGDSCPEEAYRDALKLGEELAAAQQRLSNHKNGTFGTWCKDRLGIPKQSAYRYIALHEGVPEKYRPTVGRYFDLVALSNLLSDSCPEEAFQDALKLAKKGIRPAMRLVMRFLSFWQPPDCLCRVLLGRVDV